MIFMRIWTALLAGACLAVVSTLSYAAARGLLAWPPIGREALYGVFLLAWLLMSLGCAVPAKPFSQWLVAVRLSAILLGLLFIIALLTSRDMVTLAVTGLSAGLLALLHGALTGPRIRTTPLDGARAHFDDRQ